MFNDENFHCILSGEHCKISYQNHDRSELLEHWKVLEYQYAHHSHWLQITNNENPLYANEIFQKIIRKHNLPIENAEQFYHLDQRVDQILTELTKDDLFELVISLDANMFECIEYQEDIKFYVLWDQQENDYQINDLNIPEIEPPQIFLSKTESLQSLVSSYALQEKIPNSINGTLKQLSDTPLILQSIIEQNKCFEFEDNELRIHQPETDALIAINAVLKNPLFIWRIQLASATV